MRSSACDTVSRRCVRPVLCWPAFPLVPALGSTGSAADRSAAFVGFTATMAGSDFSPPFIIGYGSSPSQCGPPASSADGRMRDLPGSDAILPRVMWPSTPAGRRCLAIAASLMLRSTMETVSAPAACPFRGSIPHPTRRLCTLRGRRRRRLAQHSLPGGQLRPYPGWTSTSQSRQLPGAPPSGLRSYASGTGQSAFSRAARASSM